MDLLLRPAWGGVDLGAIRDNTRVLADRAAPAALLAVVKADAYGHGAIQVARAVLDGGASWLGVATVREGIDLRSRGITAPIMLLSEPPELAGPAVVARRLTPIVYRAPGIEALAKAVADAGTGEALAVHLKVDTGMHRVGCAPAEALALARLVHERAELKLEGVCTHLAIADEPESSFTSEQLDCFDDLVAALRREGLAPQIVHAANSAGLLAHPRARYDLVRIGIALYGIAPAPVLAGIVPLRPALSVKARVTYVQQLPAGTRVSYGLRYELPAAARIATVPIGYADGVPRNLGLRGGEVIVRGRRRPIAGSVTMDQLMVDVGDDLVEVGDEVVLLGRQGDEEITADEWAARLGTIAYEVISGIGPRIPRRYT
ncbi:MAG: alanine racemase [Actinobacteria bacterium]|nr:MAG: alanine racemase [Actinomycetota bacterium]